MPLNNDLGFTRSQNISFDMFLVVLVVAAVPGHTAFCSNLIHVTSSFTVKDLLHDLGLHVNDCRHLVVHFMLIQRIHINPQLHHEIVTTHHCVCVVVDIQYSAV